MIVIWRWEEHFFDELMLNAHRAHQKHHVVLEAPTSRKMSLGRRYEINSRNARPQHACSSEERSELISSFSRRFFES